MFFYVLGFKKCIDIKYAAKRRLGYFRFTALLSPRFSAYDCIFLSLFEIFYGNPNFYTRFRKLRPLSESDNGRSFHISYIFDRILHYILPS